MKVQIFYSLNDEARMQAAINGWLKEHPNVNVLRITQSQSGRIDRYLTISVWYDTEGEG
jgi:hypothetical protein